MAVEMPVEKEEFNIFEHCSNVIPRFL